MPADLARYWEITLEFLKIATSAWPDYLAEKGLLDPGARRDLLIRAEARAARRAGCAGPGHRGRLDRLGAGHGSAARGHCAPAERRRRAAGPGPEPRRAKLGGGRPERARAGRGRPSAIRPEEASGAARPAPRRGAAARKRAGRTAPSEIISYPNRCAPPAQRNGGASGCLYGRRPLHRRWREWASSRPRTSAKRRSRSQFSCGRPQNLRAGSPRSSRRTALWRAGWRSS